MYRCPKESADWHEGHSGRFTAEYVQVGIVPLDASGEQAGIVEPASTDFALDTVRCAFCKARPEWIDERQVELFPVAPTLDL